MNFRYNLSGNWYKGNTHIHSVMSDGGKNFSELAEMYFKKDYDFLFRTDHMVASNVKADKEKYPLLWLDGIEIHGYDEQGSLYHIVCLGEFKELDIKSSLDQLLDQILKQNGFTILAHPYWSGNTLDNAHRWKFAGIEIYNHVCHWLNGKSHGGIHWHSMLEKNPDILGFAADDAHIRVEHPGWDGGWIMVNAPSCSSNDILNAIRNGNFYSSQGPEIFTLDYSEETLNVTTSPIRFARLVGPKNMGDRLELPAQKSKSEFSFNLPHVWDYHLLEIEDFEGKMAWTNTLLLEENNFKIKT